MVHTTFLGVSVKLESYDKLFVAEVKGRMYGWWCARVMALYKYETFCFCKLRSE